MNNISQKIIRFIKKHRREILLIGISIIGYVINAYIFFPGFMSSDTISQLMQTKGGVEINNLHPVTMVFVWKLLIATTGSMAAMLLFQLALLWASVFFLALYILRRHNNVLVSLMTVCAPFLPFVLNISGVIWKDNQMAFSYLLATVIVLWLYWKNAHWKRAWRVALLLFALLLIAYGTSVRHNAFPAAVPMIVLAVNSARVFSSLKYRVLAVVGALLFTLSLLMLLPALLNVKNIDIRTGLRVDDIIAVSSPEEIKGAVEDERLEDGLLSIQSCVRSKQYVVVGAILACEADVKLGELLTVYNDEIEDAWVEVVPKNFGKYVYNRVKTYYRSFLVPVSQYGYVWQDGIAENPYEYYVENPAAAELTRGYVVDFSYRRFAFLFEPWFWAITNIVLIAFLLRNNSIYKHVSIGLVSSSLLYLLSYLPSGATNDYRYIYWCVLATLAVVVLHVASVNTLDLVGKAGSRRTTARRKREK